MQNGYQEQPEEQSKAILYTTDDGKAQVSLMSRDGRDWLNQKQMAELFDSVVYNCSGRQSIQGNVLKAGRHLCFLTELGFCPGFHKPMEEEVVHVEMQRLCPEDSW